MQPSPDAAAVHERAFSSGRTAAAWGQRATRALLLLLLVWLLVPQTYQGASNSDSPLTGMDFKVYYQAAQRLNEGRSLYTPLDTPANDSIYMYAPAVALGLRPVARLPFPEAVKIWAACNLLLLLGAIALYALAARFSWEDTLSLAVTLLLAFRFWPTVMNFALGQLNFALLFLLCGLYLADARKRPLAAAVLVALAALLKTWMLGLLLYFIIKRQWKALAITVGCYALALGLLFSAVGWQQWPLFVGVTRQYSAQSFLVSQSVTGFARLHLAPNSLVQPFTTMPLVAPVFLAICYLGLAAGLLYLWRASAPRDGLAARLQLGLTVNSMLLLSPLCHQEYFILCLPLLWTALAPAQADEDRLPLWLMGGYFVAYVLLTRPWPVSGPGLLAHHDGLKSLLISMPFVAAILLWALTMRAVQTRKPTPAPVP